ncbi:hypothetical protein ETU10_08960 [Apibacter muscae]|uniref:hypothetical protein n=1 Tax=Apibacter muscae TaxID=2509004 RepID=UPI0011AC7162|nr:hypothetical protein [Apibacter muscae]TWP22716.1 hypothetical protein ETU10_08960 [Apibacter muscae]
MRVVELNGPLDEDGKKLEIVEKGKSYKFKITRFNREIKSPMELKNIKWAVQHNNDSPIPIAQVMGKQEVTMDISETETSGKITVYAYIQNLKEEGKAESILNLKKGGINTRFYDEKGQQVFEIPVKLHKAFNEEYGIKLAYNKDNEMLYYDGECKPAYGKTSLTAINHWKKELDPNQISKGKLLFGYNFGYELVAEPLENTSYNYYTDYSLNDFDREGNVLHLKKEKGNVAGGVVPGVPKADIQDWDDKKRKQGKRGTIPRHTSIGDIAFIDLADFTDDLNQKGFIYKYTFQRKY